jgi:hypothetical protein
VDHDAGIDAMWMMTPSPRARIAGSTASVQANGPFRITSITSDAASGCRSRQWRGPDVPAGVVDQDLRRAKPIDDARMRLADGRTVGDVGWNDHGFCPRAEQTHGLLQRLGPAACQRQPCSSAGEGQRASTADPGTRAGNPDNLSFNHCSQPFRVLPARRTAG